MNKDILSKINFENYIVKRIDFYINENFEQKSQIDLDLKFDSNIELDINNKTANIDLNCIIFDDLINNNYPFYMNVLIRGFFKFDSDLEESEIKQLLKINGTAIMFPYLRLIVSNVTTNSGIQPLILPTLNIQNALK